MPDVVEIPKPRPSDAGRWMRCPGSVALAVRFPQTYGSDAEDGTRLHDVAAGQLLGDDPASPEDARVVDPYVADVRRVAHEAGGPDHEGVELRIEQKAHWKNLPDLAGTPDALLVDTHRKRLTIWDLKTGWGLVEVWENWQLLCYAVMVMLAGWTVDLRIVQPRPYHPDGPVRSWVLTWEELQKYMGWMGKSFKEARVPGAPLRPGNHCLYCDALPGCPAAREVTLRAVKYASTEPVDLPNEYLGRELAVMRETLGILKLRTAALEEMAEHMLRNGRRVPGMAMIAGTRGGRIKWSQSDAATRSVLQMLTGKDHAVAHMPTPTQLKAQGVPEEIIKSITHHQPGKMKLSTDVDTLAKKAFGTAPNTEHIK